ncbi:MAG TPA: FtsX-like permease family protein, partial [Propionibacteriaceae bacterium]|nr:FtsX-like permease family protein [Propionibacteriaceae bacterium]
TFHRDDFEEAVDQYLEFQVFASIDDGADIEAVKAEIDTVLEPYSGIAVLDREEFIGDLASQLTAFVNVIYGLLALSIIIAMIGVANTLSLSVHERTRELGLLRAVGMTRRQLRATVRYEAVIIALFGTVLGLLIAVFFGWAMVTAVAEEQVRLAMPAPQLAVITLAATLAGVLAAVLPARRASRLDVLAAIATE